MIDIDRDQEDQGHRLQEVKEEVLAKVNTIEMIEMKGEVDQEAEDMVTEVIDMNLVVAGLNIG